MYGWHNAVHEKGCHCEDCRPRYSERGKVDAWRLHELLAAGYPLRSAEKIARSAVDLHEACELVTVRGCPPLTAAKIVL